MKEDELVRSYSLSGRRRMWPDVLTLNFIGQRGTLTGEATAASGVDGEHTLSLELFERDIVVVQVLDDRLGQVVDLGVDSNADQKNGE